MIGALKVLVVDDEPNMRTTLADILREEGCQVQVAENGAGALALCAVETFDTVLLDVRLPDTNGVEVFRQLHQQHPHMRLILMSAFSDQGLIEAAIQEGALAFLPKPLDLDQLIRLLAAAPESTDREGK